MLYWAMLTTAWGLAASVAWAVEASRLRQSESRERQAAAELEAAEDKALKRVEAAERQRDKLNAAMGRIMKLSTDAAGDADIEEALRKRARKDWVVTSSFKTDKPAT